MSAKEPTAKVDVPPDPLRLVRSASFTAALREICEELFSICDRNNNGFIDRDEYREVTKAVHSLFLPKDRMYWAWREMDKDQDGKVSLSEWLSGTEAIADFVGEEPFLTSLLKWSELETQRAGRQAERLHEKIKTEIMRKIAKGEPFEEPGSAGLTPPFAKPPAHSANVMPDKKVTSAGLQLPDPLDYELIKLLDKMPNGVQISYTDCMESSCLRFMQAMCCDAKSLDEHGRPTRVDLDLVGLIVPDLEVLRTPVNNIEYIILPQTSRGSFSAASTPIFASKYSLESSRRDLHNALLCTVLNA